jgi:phenylalanyl-tRNA synthetase beta chain
MRLPLTWLHEYTRPDLDVRALATRLAMTGTEVERIEHHGVPSVDGFVVGKVLTAEPHPDADRLKVCTVDIGEAEASQIVCGAPNVAAGQTVAVSKPGAVLPDGTKLKKAKLRGVESAGMILAEDELDLGQDHNGIMVLDDHIPAGTPLFEVLPLETDVLELEITPNRPDCLGVYGVAREVHAVTGADLAPPPWDQDPGAEDVHIHPDGIDIAVEDADLCPRFTARVFENVTIGPSPTWLKARLIAAGQRPINNVVDITNYAMLLTGHPLHAFDLDRIVGATLTVRRAVDGERMTTLDGVERTLDPDICVIADGEGVTSLAGVMGGARSEVVETTTRVLMEVAVWDGPNINRTSHRLALRSEASSRFEKRLPVEGAIEAQAVAADLMLRLTGATLVPGTVDVGAPAPDDAVIELRDARVDGLLGAPVPRDRSAQILDALGFGVSITGDGLAVTVPHWRRVDVTREADVIEEIARIVGMDDLPTTLPPNRTGLPGRLSPAQRLRRRAEDALVGRGLREVVGWSFTEPALLDRLLLPADSPLRGVVTLENPMSEAQSILRPTIFGSLLDVAAHNAARGTTDLALFESGNVYRAWPAGTEDPPSPADEHHALGGLVTGAARPATFADGEPPAADVLTAKALVDAVLGALHVDWHAEQAQRPFLHPGRAGTIHAGDTVLGIFGELHPTVAAAWGFEQPVAVFALDLGKTAAAAPPVATYEDVTTFPEVRQDLALIVPDDVPAARVVDLVREAGGKLVRGAEVFDVYRGGHVGEGRVSLALHLHFRASDRTLTDEDVAPVRAKIVERLAADLGAELRGA